MHETCPSGSMREDWVATVVAPSPLLYWFPFRQMPPVCASEHGEKTVNGYADSSALRGGREGLRRGRAGP